MIHQKGNEKLKKLFISETKSHLDQLDISLKILQKNNQSKKHNEIVSRTLHSLEGNSLTAGEHQLAYLAARISRTVHHNEFRYIPDLTFQLRHSLKLVGKKR